MSVGEKAVLTIQPDYGYGNRDVGNGLIPANSVLVNLSSMIIVF